MMAGYLKSALAEAAHHHGLGSLVSLHRGERPLIRFRVRWLWIVCAGLLIGLLLAHYRHNPPDGPLGGVVIGSVVAGYLLGIWLVPQFAAGALPPPRGRRWVALYEQALVDVKERPYHPDRAPEDDYALRVVRFDQFRQVEQHRGYSYSDGRSFVAGSAAARLVADVDGKPLVLKYHGYHRQDRFVDAVRLRLAGHPAASTTSRLRRRRADGGLVTRRKGVVATDGLGLQPAEEPVLPWPEVAGVHESGSTLSVYRRPRPGEQAMPPGAPVLWFKAEVPDAAETAALIISLRNARSG